MKKKIRYSIVILALIMLLSACGDNKNWRVEPTDVQKTQMTIENIDRIWLESLNSDLGTNYESVEQALKGQVAIYEAEKNNENLYKVCLVLLETSPRSNYYDKIIEYDGKLLDNMAEDKEFNEYINNNWPNLFKRSNMYSLMQDYLTALYESNMKEKFRYVIDNLELYIADPEEIIMTAATTIFILASNEAPEDDVRLLMDVLMECEQNYAEKVDTGHQLILATQICASADKLGETELAEEYRNKVDELAKIS